MPAGEPITLMPPRQGVRGDVPPFAIPDGYLWRSQNVLGRYGRLVRRPGYLAVVPVGPGTRISGGVYFRTVDNLDRVAVATLTKWYRLDPTAWVDISGAVTFTADADNPTRFAVFQQGGVNYIIGVNNHDALYAWDGIAGTIAAVGGSPPTTARDITSIGNYVVVGNTLEAAVRRSVRVRWSDFNNKDVWPALNFADLVALGAGDNLVAVRALGRLAMGVYLEDSVWIGNAQDGISAFRFELVSRVPGPVSPAAVVAYGSQHFYLARDGRFYKFDGYSAQPISESVDYFMLTAGLPSHFRTINRARAWGTFNPYDRNIWWFYPGSGNADPYLAVSYDVDSGAFHFHSFAETMTAGWPGDEVATLTWSDLTGTWDAIGPGTYATWDSFGGTLLASTFLGSVAGQVSRLRYDADDGGIAVSTTAEFPLKSWMGLPRSQHIDGVESFYQRIPDGPLVTVQIGKSDAAAEFPDPASYVTLGMHDTDLTTRQKLTDNADTLDTRFASVRMSYTAHMAVEYLGGLLYAWGEAEP